MTALIRAMSESDIRQVAAIEAATFPDPWSPAAFAEELESPARSYIVAEEDGEVVGYAGVMRVDDEAHLMNIAVRKDKHGGGIGRRLLVEAMAHAEALGATRITLEVRASNERAIALYEAFGLTSVGERPGYYTDSGEAAVIMWGDLPGAENAEGHLPAHAHEGELILAIETSCDETAAAVMRGGSELLANVVASQIDFHARFGGVVPEIASRKHTEAIVGVVEEALAEAGVALGVDGPLAFSALDAIAVTYGPGLVGALVVGLAYAKGLAMATGLPLVGVNHLEGHIFANVFADPEVKPPLVALVVSGGHTSLVHMPEWGVYRTMGETLDDAAGEAFDKVAKVLGLGYPGGPILSRMAEDGDPAAIDFPRAMMRSGDYAFSLSGLKTAVINHIRHERDAGREIDVPDLAASFQQAVIDVQVSKAVRAVEETGATSFCLAGGVAANPALRAALSSAIGALGVHVSVPPLHLCTDNAAMIAAAAHYRFLRGDRLGLDAEPATNLRLDTAPNLNI
jgi:N6-L-threonylcarbamoyladenine synthase